MYFIKKIKSILYSAFFIETKELSGTVKGFHSGYDIFIINGNDEKKYYYGNDLIKKDETDSSLFYLLNEGVELNFLANQESKTAFSLSIDKNKYQILNAKFDYALFRDDIGNYDAGLISNIDGKEIFLKFNLNHLTPFSQRIYNMKHGNAITALFDKEDKKLISVSL